MRCKVVELTDGETLWKAAEGQPAEQSALDKAGQERHHAALSEAKSKLLLEQGIDAGACKSIFKVLWHRVLVCVDAHAVYSLCLIRLSPATSCSARAISRLYSSGTE